MAGFQGFGSVKPLCTRQSFAAFDVSAATRKGNNRQRQQHAKDRAESSFNKNPQMNLLIETE